MALAYRRGLLTAHYHQGVRSMLREEAILHGIAMETEGLAGMQRIMMEASFSSKFTAEGARSVFKECLDAWHRYSAMVEGYSISESQHVPLTPQGRIIGDLYSALENSEVFAQIAARDQNLAEELNS